MDSHTIFAVTTLFILHGVLMLTQSQRTCFDVYVVRLESVELETGSGESGLHGLNETDPIIPSVTVSGEDRVRLTLNVTTNSTLSTNMFYNATLITTMDMMEAGSIQLCECTRVYLGTIGITDLFHVKFVCQEFRLLTVHCAVTIYVRGPSMQSYVAKHVTLHSPESQVKVMIMPALWPGFLR